MFKVRDSMAFLKDSHPEIWAYLDNLAKAPKIKPAAPAAQIAEVKSWKPPRRPRRRPPSQTRAANRLRTFPSRNPFSTPASGLTAAIPISP